MIQYIRKTLFWMLATPVIVVAAPVIFLVWIVSAYETDQDDGW